MTNVIKGAGCTVDIDFLHKIPELLMLILNTSSLGTTKTSYKWSSIGRLWHSGLSNKAQKCF